jgi:hypothetical protein
MNFRRLSHPEVATNLEAGRGEQIARKVGGYTLGILGYATGLGAVTNTLVTAGLSLPILGGISGAFFAGSRALLRPAYQDSDDYESVREESFTDKSKRLGAFIGGFALVNVGANLLTGGLFNALDGISMNAPTRVVSTIAGWITTGFGARVIRGSFDPDLHEPRDSAEAPKTLTRSFKDAFTEGRTKASNERIERKARLARDTIERKKFYTTQLAKLKEHTDALLVDYRQYSEELSSATTPEERADIDERFKTRTAEHKAARAALMQESFAGAA